MAGRVSSQTVSAAEVQAFRRNFRRYLAFYFLYDFQLWMPIWVSYLLLQREMTFTTITLIGVPFWLIVAFGQVPAGTVADRWGRTRSMAAGAGFFVASMIVFGLAGSLALIMVAWILWAFAFVLVAGADSAFLHDSLASIGRERDFEKFAGRTFAVRSVAIVAATLLGGPIASATDIRVPIFLGSVASGLALLMALGLREPPRQAIPRSESYWRALSGAARTAWRIQSVRYAIAFVAVLLAGTMTSEYLLQPFLLSHDVEVGFGFSALQVPVRLMAVAGAGGAFWWAQRVGDRRAIMTLPWLVIGAYAGLALVDHLGALGFLMFVGLVRAAVFPLVEGYINRRVPSEQRATILSLNHMAFAILVVPILPALGLSADRVDLRATFALVAAGIAILTAITGLLWIGVPRIRRRC